MSPEVYSALIGFIAAIVGGLIQSVFSWRQSHTQYVRGSRQRDYGLFLEAIAAMSQAKPGSIERIKSTALQIEAKSKIIVNGSPKVVKALHEQSKYPTLASDESYESFCLLIEAMRKDVGSKNAKGFSNMVKSILFDKYSAS